MTVVDDRERQQLGDIGVLAFLFWAAGLVALIGLAFVLGGVGFMSGGTFSTDPARRRRAAAVGIVLVWFGAAVMTWSVLWWWDV